MYRVEVIGGFLFLLFVGVLSAQVVTELNIPNTPPLLLTEIPNFTISFEGNLTPAFNLTDYFSDNEDDTLTFSYSSSGNLTLLIDANSTVSFYPDPGFRGIINLTITANDSILATESNLFSLLVGIDESPPVPVVVWKSNSSISQSDFVSFYTNWTDDYGLLRYLFSIDQGAGLLNSSWSSFSGVANTSSFTTQVSAAPGSTVSWLFCAQDLVGNVACTSTQTFDVVSTASPPSSSGGGSGGSGSGSGGSISGSVTAAALEDTTASDPISNFTVTPAQLIVLVRQGTSITKVFTVTNIGTVDLSLNVTPTSIGPFLELPQTTYSLPSGGSVDIPVDFFAELSLEPDQYFGSLLFETNVSSLRIPIVLEVTPSVLLLNLTVDVLNEENRVRVGESVVANISLAHLRDVLPMEVDLVYSVKDFDGAIYVAEEETLTLESPISLERSFVLPEDFPAGRYLFYARAQSGNLTALDSDVFEAGVRFSFAAFIRSSLIFILLFFLSFIAAFLLWRHHQQKEREMLLNLYVMLSEMRKLIVEGKFDQAVSLYTRVKLLYGEPIPPESLENREQLKEAVAKLSDKLEKDLGEIAASEAAAEGSEEKTPEGDAETGSEKKDGTSPSDEEKNSDAPAEKKDGAKDATDSSTNSAPEEEEKSEEKKKEEPTPEQKETSESSETKEKTAEKETKESPVKEGKEDLKETPEEKKAEEPSDENKDEKKTAEKDKTAAGTKGAVKKKKPASTESSGEKKSSKKEQ